jgi:hypothetical protein
MSQKFYCDKCGREFFVAANGSPLGGAVTIKSTLVDEGRRFDMSHHHGEYCVGCSQALRSRLFALAGEFRLKLAPSD